MAPLCCVVPAHPYLGVLSTRHGAGQEPVKTGAAGGRGEGCVCLRAALPCWLPGGGGLRAQRAFSWGFSQVGFKLPEAVNVDAISLGT